MRQRSKSEPGSVKLLPPTGSWSIRACTETATPQQHTGRVWVKELTIKSLKYREHSPQFTKYISYTSVNDLFSSASPLQKQKQQLQK